MLTFAVAMDRALRNAYFAKRGLVFLVDLLRQNLVAIAAPTQLELALG